MTNKSPTEFLSFSVSVSMPKLEPKNDTLKTYYFKEPKTDQSNVCGSEDVFYLTCWRDSATANIGCQYVFGVKSNNEISSKSEEHYYRFVEPHSKGEVLQWSQAQSLTSNEFCGTDNRLFYYESSQNEKKLKHLKSEKYVSINNDHQIVLKTNEECAGNITITDQTS